MILSEMGLRRLAKSRGGSSGWGFGSRGSAMQGGGRRRSGGERQNFWNRVKSDPLLHAHTKQKNYEAVKRYQARKKMKLLMQAQQQVLMQQEQEQPQQQHEQQQQQQQQQPAVASVGSEAEEEPPVHFKWEVEERSSDDNSQ